MNNVEMDKLRKKLLKHFFEAYKAHEGNSDPILRSGDYQFNLGFEEITADVYSEGEDEEMITIVTGDVYENDEGYAFNTFQYTRTKQGEWS